MLNIRQSKRNTGYNFAFLDENTKREIRRKTLKAVAIPGYQVPFASPELPIARGWGTGGLQVTMAIIGQDDILKVIDQGCDGGVNAVNIRNLITKTTGVKTTFNTLEATILQTRHRIPEEPMDENQIVVLQVPIPEPLRFVEASMAKAQEMHAEMDYSRMWVFLYEDIVKWGEITIGARYPSLVNHRYLIDPSPIPRWDVPKLNMADTLFLFGAGREKRIYAVPPHTRVEPMEFEDHRFRVEDFTGRACVRCGAIDTYMNEIYDERSGKKIHLCSDSSHCDKVREQKEGRLDVGK
ncbi:Alpha-D-ribose 1-methylphosphonate 5-phosphate C-P lyase [Sporomusa silvacetica DSM 10669]|uniref:Alpha-D-ribose 1-methylphosphonate 5-phosphate C-P lyase n=1 Tax=Sporomusa silvacetica DSM 10669 TaxID=1123289 RepID=A0ABZ3IRQ5_9FIRM|nr:alpha-D-ribose 1-methylphosphonate 5-phosphate C-P-lyase PhnJ [Sporomusa silvacetica]OZC20842.1 alpha-D-ribose 1-methylphosphonate 5-phosphate C-P lyase [Sporomusa silvacetica DSM 10669]